MPVKSLPVKIDKYLDKCRVLDYIFLYDKGNDEEEYASPLKRESGCPVFSAEDGRWKAAYKEGMRKVASEPENPGRTGGVDAQAACGGKFSRVIPVIG